MVKCKICEKEFDDDSGLHRHLRAHSIRMVEYYQTHFPRYDLHTGDIIKFKNKAQYFSSDFNSRIHLKHWLKSQPTDKAKKYCDQILLDRKEKKKIEYAPTQVELRTIMSPPVQYCEVLYGDYYKHCKDELNLKTKYIKISGDAFKKSKEFNEPIVYLDTREQLPLKFKNCSIRVKTLPFGDYCFFDNSHTANCYIERKSIKDFIGTLSGGFERFEKEIKRAEESQSSLIVLVERSLNECIAFRKLPYVSKKIKATPEFIFSNVRTLIQKYPNVQFLFVNGREESVRVIEKIFFNGDEHKKYDLQLAYDLKIL
tara:strand:+ start:10679 stop:11617 length:939 start_codon:yes stop_codon:yes gene_type:complete